MKNIALIVVFIALANSSELSVTCGACTIACGAGFKCYKLSGTGFQSEICSTQTSCPPNPTVKYNIFKCQADILAQQCATGVCAFPEFKSCLEVNNCPNYEVSSECGRCSSLNGCDFCLSNSGGAVCVDDTFSGCDWSAKSVIGSCSNNVDGQGNTCSCCSQIIRVSGNMGYCTNADPKLSQSSAGLQAWAQSETFYKLCGIILMTLMILY